MCSMSIDIKAKLQSPFLDGKYKLNFDGDDKLNIKVNDESWQFNLVYEYNELEEEVQKIKYQGEFFTAGEKFLNFILIDGNDLVKDKQIKIEGELFSGIIQKQYQSFGLLVNNFTQVLDIDKIENRRIHTGSDITIDEIIDRKYAVCELKCESGYYDFSDIRNVERIINSVITFLAYNKEITLDNPRNRIDITSGFNIAISDDDILLKPIRDNETMLYYLSAEKIVYPHLKYLEYYHVIEYYFLHKRMEDMEKIIKDLITIQLSNTKNSNDSYYNKLSDLMEHYLTDKKDNELEQLKYVIGNDIGYNVICSYLNDNFESLKFLGDKIFDIDNTVVSLNSVSEIQKVKKIIDGKKKEITVTKLKKCDLLNVEDRDIFCDNLATRIYKIRNKIVHTKKYEKNNIFNVFTPVQSNFTALINDIKLIRMLSFALMTKR